jgi:hypothetical protein
MQCADGAFACIKKKNTHGDAVCVEAVNTNWCAHNARSYIEFPRNDEHSGIGNFDFKVLRKIHQPFNVYCRIRSLRAMRTSGGDLSAALRHDAIETLYSSNKASILAGSTCLAGQRRGSVERASKRATAW